jgi:hypothetical protein
MLILLMQSTTLCFLQDVSFKASLGKIDREDEHPRRKRRGIKPKENKDN